MTDDISTLTLKLAQDPSSLAFLPLAEALRRHLKGMRPAVKIYHRDIYK